MNYKEEFCYIKKDYFYKFKYINEKPLDEILKINDNMKNDIIVINDFYDNPHSVREYALKQDFNYNGNYPGVRTQQFLTDKFKMKFQELVNNYGKINDFFMLQNPDICSNGCFQITTSTNRSWIHNDKPHNWAGIIYLTPDAPLNSGTTFYNLKKEYLLDNIDYSDNINIKDYGYDITKWDIVDKIGNVFNRLVLFNSKRYHMSSDYFGNNNDNGRLTQVFFFSVEEYSKNVSDISNNKC